MSRTTETVFSPDALIDAMREAGLTPQDLMEELGCGPDQIGRWMAGFAVPRPGYQKQIARILGVSVDDLYEEVE